MAVRRTPAKLAHRIVYLGREWPVFSLGVVVQPRNRRGLSFDGLLYFDDNRRLMFVQRELVRLFRSDLADSQTGERVWEEVVD